MSILLFPYVGIKGFSGFSLPQYVKQDLVLFSMPIIKQKTRKKDPTLLKVLWCIYLMKPQEFRLNHYERKPGVGAASRPWDDGWVGIQTLRWGGESGPLPWICHWGWGGSEDQKISHSPHGGLLVSAPFPPHPYGNLN